MPYAASTPNSVPASAGGLEVAQSTAYAPRDAFDVRERSVHAKLELSAHVQGGAEKERGAQAGEECCVRELHAGISLRREVTFHEGRGETPDP